MMLQTSYQNHAYNIHETLNYRVKRDASFVMKFEIRKGTLFLTRKENVRK